MKNWLTTLPAALALTGGLLWFAAPPATAQDDCYSVEVCVTVGGTEICGSVEVCF